MLSIINPKKEDSPVSLSFILFLLAGIIWITISNSYFIEMPWGNWLSTNISKGLAIIIALTIGISFALLPLTYRTHLRPWAILLCTVLFISGSFWKLSHTKAPLINKMILLSSVIAFVTIRQFMKRRKERT